MKRLLLITAAVVIVILIGFIVLQSRTNHSRFGPSRASTESPLLRLKVGYIPIVECAHLYVGITRKYFQEEGIEIELQPMKGGAVILPALQTGDLDVGFANVVSVITTNATLESRAPRAFVTLVGASYERPGNVNHALLIKKDSSITVEALGNSNTRIALNTTRNIEDLMLRRFLKSKGVNDSKLNLVTMGFPDMLSALDRSDVEVVSVVEPFIQPALRTGKYRLLANQYIEVSNETVVATYACTNAWLEAHADAAARFSRAFSHANDFIKSNEVETRDIIGSFTRIRKDDLAIIGIPSFELAVKLGPLRELSHEMRRFDFIKSEPNLSDILRAH